MVDLVETYFSGGWVEQTNNLEQQSKANTEYVIYKVVPR
jgi:hypothetical protein